MVYGGFLTLTYSHLHHYSHFPAIMGFCRGGNMLGNHYHHDHHHDHRHDHHHHHQVEGQSLGVVPHANTPELKEVIPGSQAAQVKQKSNLNVNVVSPRRPG